MKRDMELVRKIMLQLQASDGAQPDLQPLIDAGYSERQLAEHSLLLVDAGLAEALVHEQGGLDDDGQLIILSRLTWAGHDFIEPAKNDVVWKKATGLVMSQVGGFTLEALKAAVGAVTKELVAAGVRGGN
jgi:hypothetical protein